MADQLLKPTYSTASGQLSDQSEYTESLIHPEDGTADAVVTDFPAVEVEVQARSVQEVSGIQTLTAVTSLECEMNSGTQEQYQDANSQGNSDDEQTADSTVQIIIAPTYSKTDNDSTVYMISAETANTNPKGDIKSFMSHTYSVDKHTAESKEVKLPMHVSTQVNLDSPCSDVSSSSGNKLSELTSVSTRPTDPSSVISPSGDVDNEHTASQSQEVTSAHKSESSMSKSQKRLLQQVELRGKNEAVTTGTKPADKTMQRNLLWCEDCGKTNTGSCKKHGALAAISDSHVPTYARLTLPSVLSIKSDAKGEGVFAKRYIKSRSQFGPLQAPFQKESNKKDDKQPYFYLKGYNDDDVFCQYNLNDENQCNWMMFVRPAKTYDEQNLVAYIYNGSVYYATTKPIEYGKELKVWYCADYAVKIGMSLFTDLTGNTDMKSDTQSVDQHRGTSNKRTGTASDDGEDVDVDSGDEFQIVENDELSDDANSETYCLHCDTVFKSKERLFSHSCKSKRTSSKRGRGCGATRRKGSPRKLTLDDDWDPDDDGKEVKARRLKRRLGRKAQDRTKSVRAKKAKKVVVESPRKKYQRTPKFTCSYCPEVFSCQDPYRAHEASHTGKSAYMCDYEGCGKGFDTKFTYWRHMLCHKKPNDKQCPYCDKSFNRVDHLKTHLKTHDQQRFSYLCDKCGKSYLHKTTYDYHIALHEAKEGESLVCMICSEQFPDKEELIKHAHSHNRYKSLSDMPKTHPCPVCNRMFGTSKDVRRHMIVHTKEKHFLCELCPQTFGRKDHLRRHYKTNHSKEPRKEKVEPTELPFSCEFCQQKFAKKKLLANHKKLSHEQNFQPQLHRAEEHPLQQAAGDITEASVTSSSYNLYTLSTPQVNPVSIVQNQAAKALERYINVTSPSAVLGTPPSVMDSPAPVTYINGQANMPVNVMPQVREQCPEQMQQVKERVIFQPDQMVSQRQPRQVPWAFVVEDREDHSYSTAAPPVWTPKVPSFRPTVSSAAEVETARLLQSAQSTQSTFPVQCNNATTMAVAWDTMTEYFAVQPCSNITEVVTSPSIVHQSQPQQQPQNQNIPQPQRGHLQQNHQ